MTSTSTSEVLSRLVGIVIVQIDVALVRDGESYQPHYKEASVAFSRITTPGRGELRRCYLRPC